MTRIIRCVKAGVYQGLLLLLVALLGWAGGMSSAWATVRTLEESPGQVVVQSRQSLQDQHGRGWQVIAFKRQRPDDTATFAVRLVGFPGSVTIDRALPLTLTNSLGKTVTAADASGKIFTDAERPEPHVGQYDLQPILAELQAEIPLQITLPTVDDEAVRLMVPAALVKEWQSVANAG
ncbi:MAG: DUF3122 domain-containing protein [Spirulina sp.]